MTRTSHKTEQDPVSAGDADPEDISRAVFEHNDLL